MIEPFVVDALAVYRITRLVVDDVILDAPRERMFGWLDGRSSARPSKVAELLDCSWCVAVWVAFGVVGLRGVLPRAWAPVARGLALSAVAGLISEYGPGYDTAVQVTAGD